MTPGRQVLCPECGRLAVDEVIYPYPLPSRLGTTVREGSYLCPLGHQFLMRWNTVGSDQEEVS